MRVLIVALHLDQPQQGELALDVKQPRPGRADASLKAADVLVQNLAPESAAISIWACVMGVEGAQPTYDH